MRYLSPLRYPGGKSKLLEYIKVIIKENDIYDYTYIEPFSGGAGVALGLLFDEYVSDIIINDLDIHIYAFWYSILNYNSQIIGFIEDVEVSVKTWEKMKEIYSHPEKYSILEIGQATFFLNRTNKSGILTGGIIGGKNQLGKYKIDARFNKDKLIERIDKIYRYKNRIKVFNFDASVLISKIKDITINNVLYYFDPPYFNKSQDLYLNHFSLSDHETLSRNISMINDAPCIITYDNVKEIRSMYENFDADEFNLNYNAHNFSIGKEIMFYHNLQMPPYEKKEQYLGVGE